MEEIEYLEEYEEIVMPHDPYDLLPVDPAFDEFIEEDPLCSVYRNDFQFGTTTTTTNTSSNSTTIPSTQSLNGIVVTTSTVAQQPTGIVIVQSPLTTTSSSSSAATAALITNTNTIGIDGITTNHHHHHLQFIPQEMVETTTVSFDDGEQSNLDNANKAHDEIVETTITQFDNSGAIIYTNPEQFALVQDNGGNVKVLSCKTLDTSAFLNVTNAIIQSSQQQQQQLSTTPNRTILAPTEYNVRTTHSSNNNINTNLSLLGIPLSPPSLQYQLTTSSTSSSLPQTPNLQILTNDNILQNTPQLINTITSNRTKSIGNNDVVYPRLALNSGLKPHNKDLYKQFFLTKKSHYDEYSSKGFAKLKKCSIHKHKRKPIKNNDDIIANLALKASSLLNIKNSINDSNDDYLEYFLGVKKSSIDNKSKLITNDSIDNSTFDDNANTGDDTIKSSLQPYEKDDDDENEEQKLNLNKTNLLNATHNDDGDDIQSNDSLIDEEYLNDSSSMSDSTDNMIDSINLEIGLKMSTNPTNKSKIKDNENGLKISTNTSKTKDNEFGSKMTTNAINATNTVKAKDNIDKPFVATSYHRSSYTLPLKDSDLSTKSLSDINSKFSKSNESIFKRNSISTKSNIVDSDIIVAKSTSLKNRQPKSLIPLKDNEIDSGKGDIVNKFKNLKTKFGKSVESIAKLLKDEIDAIPEDNEIKAISVGLSKKMDKSLTKRPNKNVNDKMTFASKQIDHKKPQEGKITNVSTTPSLSRSQIIDDVINSPKVLRVVIPRTPYDIKAKNSIEKSLTPRKIMTNTRDTSIQDKQIELLQNNQNLDELEDPLKGTDNDPLDIYNATSTPKLQKSINILKVVETDGNRSLMTPFDDFESFTKEKTNMLEPINSNRRNRPKSSKSINRNSTTKSSSNCDVSKNQNKIVKPEEKIEINSTKTAKNKIIKPEEKIEMNSTNNPKNKIIKPEEKIEINSTNNPKNKIVKPEEKIEKNSTKTAIINNPKNKIIKPEEKIEMNSTNNPKNKIIKPEEKIEKNSTKTAIINNPKNKIIKPEEKIEMNSTNNPKNKIIKPEEKIEINSTNNPKNKIIKSDEKTVINSTKTEIINNPKNKINEKNDSLPVNTNRKESKEIKQKQTEIVEKNAIKMLNNSKKQTTETEEENNKISSVLPSVEKTNVIKKKIDETNSIKCEKNKKDELNKSINDFNKTPILKDTIRSKRIATRNQSSTDSRSSSINSSYISKDNSFQSDRNSFSNEIKSKLISPKKSKTVLETDEKNALVINENNLIKTKTNVDDCVDTLNEAIKVVNTSINDNDKITELSNKKSTHDFDIILNNIEINEQLNLKTNKNKGRKMKSSRKTKNKKSNDKQTNEDKSNVIVENSYTIQNVQNNIEETNIVANNLSTTENSLQSDNSITGRKSKRLKNENPKYVFVQPTIMTRSNRKLLNSRNLAAQIPIAIAPQKPAAKIIRRRQSNIIQISRKEYERQINEKRYAVATEQKESLLSKLKEMNDENLVKMIENVSLTDAELLTKYKIRNCKVVLEKLQITSNSNNKISMKIAPSKSAEILKQINKEISKPIKEVTNDEVNNQVEINKAAAITSSTKKRKLLSTSKEVEPKMIKTSENTQKKNDKIASQVTELFESSDVPVQILSSVVEVKEMCSSISSINQKKALIINNEKKTDGQKEANLQIVPDLQKKTDSLKEQILPEDSIIQQTVPDRQKAVSNVTNITDNIVEPLKIIENENETMSKIPSKNNKKKSTKKSEPIVSNIKESIKNTSVNDLPSNSTPQTNEPSSKNTNKIRISSRFLPLKNISDSSLPSSNLKKYKSTPNLTLLDEEINDSKKLDETIEKNTSGTATPDSLSIRTTTIGLRSRESITPTFKEMDSVKLNVSSKRKSTISKIDNEKKSKLSDDQTTMVEKLVETMANKTKTPEKIVETMASKTKTPEKIVEKSIDKSPMEIDKSVENIVNDTVSIHNQNSSFNLTVPNSKPQIFIAAPENISRRRNSESNLNEIIDNNLTIPVEDLTQTNLDFSIESWFQDLHAPSGAESTGGGDTSSICSSYTNSVVDQDITATPLLLTPTTTITTTTTPPIKSTNSQLTFSHSQFPNNFWSSSNMIKNNNNNNNNNKNNSNVNVNVNVNNKSITMPPPPVPQQIVSTPDISSYSHTQNLSATSSSACNVKKINTVNIPAHIVVQTKFLTREEYKAKLMFNSLNASNKNSTQSNKTTPTTSATGSTTNQNKPQINAANYRNSNKLLEKVSEFLENQLEGEKHRNIRNIIEMNQAKLERLSNVKKIGYSSEFALQMLVFLQNYFFNTPTTIESLSNFNNNNNNNNNVQLRQKTDKNINKQMNRSVTSDTNKEDNTDNFAFRKIRLPVQNNDANRTNLQSANNLLTSSLSSLSSGSSLSDVIIRNNNNNNNNSNNNNATSVHHNVINVQTPGNCGINAIPQITLRQSTSTHNQPNSQINMEVFLSSNNNCGGVGVGVGVDGGLGGGSSITNEPESILPDLNQIIAVVKEEHDDETIIS